jgi:hypothetical protein
MRLASDFPYPTPNVGRCRVRIYEPEDKDRDSFVVIHRASGQPRHERHGCRQAPRNEAAD